MNPQFKAWLIEKHEKLVPEEKEGLLIRLWLYPEEALKFISDNILGWLVLFRRETGIALKCDYHLISQEILEVFQKHFAKATAEIT